jgi:hypothetical protein
VPRISSSLTRVIPLRLRIRNQSTALLAHIATPRTVAAGATKFAPIAAVILMCGGQVAPDPRCVSAEGAHICGGPNSCPLDCNCFDGSGNGVGICVNELQDTSCFLALDGAVCIDNNDACAFSTDDICWDSGAIDVAKLLGLNGASDRVRYADWSEWTDTPLPEPSNCPVLALTQLCGPSCSGCPTGTFCHGRSPLHPFGICLPVDVGQCGPDQACPTPGACFTYKVQDDVQGLANVSGMCFSASAICDDLAQNLPGGGSCN